MANGMKRAAAALAFATGAAGLGGCATNGPRPFSSGSTYQQDNTTAVMAGVGTGAAVHLAGGPHAAAAGLVVASVMKLTSAFSLKDYCSSRSVQMASSRAYSNGVPIDGGVQNIRQTECVQSNVTYKPGTVIPVVYDGSKTPEVLDRTFEVIEERPSRNPLTGVERPVPLVRDVTACQDAPEGDAPDSAASKAAKLCRANKSSNYLLHVFERESVNQTTGEKTRSNVLFLNAVDIQPKTYAPPQQFQPAAAQQQYYPSTQACTGLAAVISVFSRGDCRVHTRDLQGLGGTAPQ